MATYENAFPQTIGPRPELISPQLLSSILGAQASQFNAGVGLAGTELQTSERANEANMNRLSSTFANLPGQIRAAKQFQTELPVMQQKAQTELLQQQLGQKRLRNLLGANSDQDISPMITSVGPGGAISVAPSPPIDYTRTATQQQPVPTTSGGSRTESLDQSQDQSTQPSASAAANPESVASTAKLPAPAPQSIGEMVGNKAVFGTPAPTQQPAASPQTSAQPSAANNAPIAQASSPTPLDAQAALAGRTHVTPEEALAWYQQNVSTDAAHARQEFDPKTGLATNRIVISHQPPGKGQPAKPDQPVHSAYILANPGAGGWMSPTGTQPNPALAMAPKDAKALSLAAAAPIAQQVQNTIEQGAGLPTSISPISRGGAVMGPPNVQPAPIAPTMATAQPTAVAASPGNPLAEQLAAGTLNPSQITAQGGPLWAGARNAPMAPLRSQVSPSRPLVLAPPVPPPLPPVPTALSANGQPVPTENGNPSVRILPDAQDQIKQWSGGMSPQQILDAVKDHKYTKIGTDDTQPDAEGSKPSQIINFRYLNHDFTGYLDQGGFPYMRILKEPFEEVRLYMDGKERTVTNKIGEKEDQDMMQTCMEEGTVSGGWQGLSRQQKIEAYKMAQTLKTNPVNDKASERERLLMDVLNSGNNLINLTTSPEMTRPNAQYGTRGNPEALDVRSTEHQKYSDLTREWGPNVVGMSHGLLKDNEVPEGDPRVQQLRQAYEQFQTAARKLNQTDMPQRVPGTTNPEEIKVPTLPPFEEPQLTERVQDAMKVAGVQLAQHEAMMHTNHWRTSADAMYKASQIMLGDKAPGTERYPLKASDAATYDRLPQWSYYQWPGTDAQGRPWPVQQKKYKTMAEAQEARKKAQPTQ